jgi:hypothetical protein
MDLHVTGDGSYAHMPADRVDRAQAAFEQRVRDAEKFNRHVWITTVAHSMTDEQVRRILDGTAGDQFLDVETVAVTGIGCYRCEQALDEKVVDQPCPGDPAPSEAELLGAIQGALRAGDLRGAVALTRQLATINPAAAAEIHNAIRQAMTGR